LGITCAHVWAARDRKAELDAATACKEEAQSKLAAALKELQAAQVCAFFTAGVEDFGRAVVGGSKLSWSCRCFSS
jgi:hypothetical protein